MNLNTLAQEIFNTAKQKGWYDFASPPAQRHMLMVTEIAEATEEARKDMPPVYTVLDGNVDEVSQKDLSDVEMFMISDDAALTNRRMLKPEGELIELADCVIRILDYCGSKNWDIEAAIKIKHAYNQTREHRHGGKKF